MMDSYMLLKPRLGIEEKSDVFVTLTKVTVVSDFRKVFGPDLLQYNGTAELFGSELLLKNEYKLPSGKWAIFSWHGCEISVKGKPAFVYSSSAKDTPMRSVLNTHTALEALRTQAATGVTPAPRVMIVGPADSGKSTVCQLLLNYAVRAGHCPMFIDLDVEQNAISIPGSIAAVPLDVPVPVDSDALTENQPVSFFLGHTNVQTSKTDEIYRKLVSALAKSVNAVLEHPDSKCRSGGAIINTGSVDAMGFDSLIHAIQQFKTTCVIVVGVADRLYNDLKLDPRVGAGGVTVLKLHASGGVVARDPGTRTFLQAGRIKAYFYGKAAAGGKLQFTAHQQSFPTHLLPLFRIGGAMAAPASALPIGAKRLLDPHLPTKVDASAAAHKLSIIAVSQAKNPSNLLDEPVYGYMHLLESGGGQLVCLAPSQVGPLVQAGSALNCLIGTVKWFE